MMLYRNYYSKLPAQFGTKKFRIQYFKEEAKCQNH